MDRSRLAVIAAAAITAVASVAAVAAAVTSDDDGGSTVASTPAAAGAVPIEIRDFAFHPPDATVTVDGQALWTNADGLAHSIRAEDGSFTSPDLDTGDTFPFTFTEPGTYPYVCGIHASMHGTIVVQG